MLYKIFDCYELEAITIFIHAYTIWGILRHNWSGANFLTGAPLAEDRNRNVTLDISRKIFEPLQRFICCMYKTFVVNKRELNMCPVLMLEFIQLWNTVILQLANDVWVLQAYTISTFVSIITLSSSLIHRKKYGVLTLLRGIQYRLRNYHYVLVKKLFRSNLFMKKFYTLQVVAGIEKLQWLISG